MFYNKDAACQIKNSMQFVKSDETKLQTIYRNIYHHENMTT